jgi:hypothetical protein
MSKAQEAIQRARRTATAAKADATRMAAGAVTSYLVGSMEAAGTMAQVPQLMGLPRTVTLAILGKLVAYNTGGTISEGADGAATAAANIAIYQFSRGQTVSGVEGAIHDRGRRLQSAAQRALAQDTEPSAEQEIAALEGAAPRGRTRAAHS